MSYGWKLVLPGCLVLAVACGTESGGPLEPDTGATAALIRISDGTTWGSGLLTRLSDGITTNITVDPGVIPPGDVITLWGVIFNDPSKCTAGLPGVSSCDEADLENSDVAPSVVWLGGGIAAGGSTLYTGQVMAGDASGDILALFGLPSGPGLLNPAGAEIHVILRTHGPPIPGQLQAQSTTFLGPNCTVEAPPSEPCADLLFAVFEPVP